MGNHGTSANSSSHTESSWRLNELMDGVLYESRCQPLELLQTIDVGNKGPIQRVISNGYLSKRPPRSIHFALEAKMDKR